MKIKASIFRIRTLADQGLRVELDVPESHLKEVAMLMALRGRVLDVDIKQEDENS